jgi:methionine aminopeptidase
VIQFSRPWSRFSDTPWGLECESPFITSTASEIIVPDMVLAIECFLGEGQGRGAGFEHVIHVKDNGVDILTDLVESRPSPLN